MLVKSKMFFTFLFFCFITFLSIFYFKKKSGIVYAAVAGNSGGHIIPALTLLDKIRKKENDSKVLFFTTTNKLDQAIIAKSDIVDQHICLNLPNIVNKKFFHYPLYAILCASAFFKSFVTLIYFNPQELIATGGFVGIPVSLAAWMLRIPISLYELNVEPGQASKILGPLATNIKICFEETKKQFSPNKTELINYPIRFDSQCLDIEKNQAKKLLGLDENKKTIFVIGGSQGSDFINEMIKKWFCQSKIQGNKFNVQVIHQTGAKCLKKLQKFYCEQKINSIVFDFKKDINLCYSAADLIISRAGAGSLAEILFFSKPAIIIPLHLKANLHQVNNAQAVAKKHPEFVKVYDQNFIETNQQDFFISLNITLSQN